MSTASSLDASFILVDNDIPKSPRKTSSPLKKAAPKQLSHPSLNLSYKPGSIPNTYAHDWSSLGVGGEIAIEGRHFVDAYGRVCQLRGVNLSGACKTPANHDHENFPGDHKSVTFVGRPFPLEQAPEHFARLRRWGLTFIRFLVTWEAVEHKGPGMYDTKYLEYLRKLLSLLPKYGLTAFVSMHQDVWSRYSGGSGAPAWTLELVGFDLNAIEDTGAAWLHGMRGGGHVEAERGLWPCGYHKLTASTMATCFWGGDIFAPKLLVKDKQSKEVPIQQFLQNAFLDMWDVVARTVRDLEGVIGFQMINEPHSGYINASLHGFDYNTNLHLSHIPSAFQSFQLGAGYPTLVPTYTRSFPMPTTQTSLTLLNTSKVKAWRPDGPTQGRCLWEYHDVWRWDTVQDKAIVLRENYFRHHPDTGKKIEWYTDMYYPLLNKWSERVRNVTSNSKLVFLEPIPNEFCPESLTKECRPDNMVFAPHWYDLNSLFKKSFGNFTVNVQGISRGMFILKTFYWGQKGARENFSLQIRNIVENSYKSLGETPVIIGECGIPMDMNKKEAFKTGNFIWQSRMMDAMITGLERAMVGFTLWNYNPDNDDERGDDWNGENFSWFSRKRALPLKNISKDQTEQMLDNGARILQSIVRPYPTKTSGIPLKFEYEMNTGMLTYEWMNPLDSEDDNESSLTTDPPRTLRRPLTSRETEVFFPDLSDKPRKMILSGLESDDKFHYDRERQTLFIVTANTTPGNKHFIRAGFFPVLQAEFEVNGFWGDYGGRILSALVILIALYVRYHYYYFG